MTLNLLQYIHISEIFDDGNTTVTKAWMGYYILVFCGMQLFIHQIQRRLTHRGREISQTIFPNAFFFMKMYEFWLKLILKGPINNIPALVQIMDCRRPGDNPLFESMMVNLPTHICVTRSQFTIGVRIGMRYHTPQFYVDVITYPFPIVNTGFANRYS